MINWVEQPLDIIIKFPVTETSTNETEEEDWGDLSEEG